MHLMQLREYLDTHNISITAFADQIGVTRITIHSYLSEDKAKRKVPSPETLEKIWEATNRQVRPDDFFPFCEPSAQAAKAKAGRKDVKGGMNSSP
jgi:hypothetical protein